MRAITYSKFGTAKDVLQFQDIETPTAGTGEVLVRLKTSAVNPSDVRARAGGRPGIVKPPFPLIIPHSDGAGIIEAVGPNVPASRIGEPVWIWNGQWQRPFGTAAEYIAIPSEQAVLLPDTISFEAGAILGIPALTATYCVLSDGDIAGQILFISGGAGTVGRLAIQIAKASGATVITSVGNEAAAKSALAAGADAVFRYDSPTLPEDILDFTSGRLIDRIIEAEFGKNIQTNIQIIKPLGKIVTIGSAKSMTPELPYYQFLFKAVTIDFALIYLLENAERQYAIEALTNLLIGGNLSFQIFAKLGLKDAAEAHDLVAEGKRTGSVILEID